MAALQEAYRVSPEDAFNPLTDALVAWRKEAADAGDDEALRDATLTLAELLRARGALAEARQFVYELLGRGKEPDPRAMTLARRAGRGGGRSGGRAGDRHPAAPACCRARRRSRPSSAWPNLAERVGRPAEATAQLEAALAANPGQARLVERLVQLYERAGDVPKLAMLLFDEAHRSQDEAQRFGYLVRAGTLFVQSGEARWR